MKLEAKGIKSFVGREGHGFEASLYVDGKKAATVLDSADGGEMRWTTVNGKLVEAFNSHVDNLPEYECEFGGMAKDGIDMIMARLVDEWQANKWLKAQCRKKTLFRLIGDDPSSWRTVKAPYSAEVKKFITKKYPNIEKIANEA